MLKVSRTFAAITQVCNFTGGTQPPKSEFVYEPQPGFIRLLQIRDFADDTKAVYVNQKNRLQLCRESDILIARYGASLGRILRGKAGAYNVALCKVEPKSEALSRDYLYRLLRAPQFQMFLHKVGDRSAQAGFNKSNLENFKLPLPPLEEQRRIAEILDLADGLRVKRREALAEVEGLTEAVFLEMFGRVLRQNIQPMKNILQPIESGKSPICLQKPASPGEWGILKVGSVSKGHWDPTENKAITPETIPNSAHEVHIGDLLFVRKNTYELVGTTAIVSETPSRLLMPDLIFRLKPKKPERILVEYLNSLLKTEPLRFALKKLASGTSGSMPNISKARLLTLKIPVPPLPLQQKFAERVEAIEKLKASHQRSLDEMDALFASLQSRAFKGEL